MVGQPTFVAGGTPVMSSASDLQRSQIGANVTLRQPTAPAFRLSDALTLTQNSTNSFQSDISGLQQQVATLQNQVTNLQTQMQNVLNFINFSQSEVATGIIFLDQQQIYKRSYAYSGINAINNVYIAAHGIQNLAYLAFATCTMGVANNVNIPLAWLNPTVQPWADGTTFYIDNTNIYIVNGSTNRSSYIFLVTLWYTKLTGSGDPGVITPTVNAIGNA